MKCTSAETAKLLKKIQDKKEVLQSKEMISKSFYAALGENVESVRPVYDYQKTQDELRELDRQVRIIKHAINCFNTTHIVPGFDLTIDQMLIYIPQLSELKYKYHTMFNTLAKRRSKVIGSGTSGVIDYEYANYDIDVARQDYERTSDELARAQIALDTINTSETMEIDL